MRQANRRAHRTLPAAAKCSGEVARGLVEFCLDLRRALEFALAVARRTRTELAVVAQNLLPPAVVRRLVFEVRVHRVDAVENAPAPQGPLDEWIAPSEFRRRRRLEDHRLEQDGA